MTSLTRANALAFALPAGLMAGALGSQYLGGLYPCEMCHWQRWPHYAAIALALIAFASPSNRRPLVTLAAVAILGSGLIGAFHAGVEYHWWPGITSCARTATGSSMAEILRAPIVRCDQAQWTLAGISLAGYNAIFSIGGALLIFTVMRKVR